MRYEQVQRILDLVRVHILEREQPLIIAGDFNAYKDEFGIKQLLKSEQGFIRLAPRHRRADPPRVESGH